MELGLTPKTQAWIRVSTLTLGVFMTAFQGASSDEWVSTTEWVSILGTTMLTFLSGLSGAPKDARNPEEKTRATD